MSVFLIFSVSIHTVYHLPSPCTKSAKQLCPHIEPSTILSNYGKKSIGVT